MNVSSKALIMVASRPAGVREAVEHLHPEVVGLILSEEILEHMVPVSKELRADNSVDFRYSLVEQPMEIEDAFGEFEHLLSELKAWGTPGEHLLDPTGGTTPMRFGVALAAMTRGIRMIHQRAPQSYVNGRWELEGAGRREIAPMGNPLEATGLLREGQAVELFNRRDYEAAALVFEEVGKVSGVERGTITRAPAPLRRVRSLGRRRLRRGAREAEGRARGVGRRIHGDGHLQRGPLAH